MKNFFLKLWKDEEGAEMVEWAIVVGLVVIAAIGAYTLLGQKVSSTATEVANKLDTVIT
ncbi:MAG: Flp family type IVb pilin [Gammaproteobacteria bacterium]|nr:Flp family type IVb pilin [Gammaproteobacteria bacterium]